MKKKKVDGIETNVTLVLFNTDIEFIYKRKPIDEVPALDSETYEPSGCTALHDAMGESITYMDKIVKEEYNEND